MKKFILGGINLIFYIYYKYKLIFELSFDRKNQTIVFVDIDNTIADTWPSIKNSEYSNEVDRHENLKAFEGMKVFIQSKFRDDQHKLIYLTARCFNLIKVTHRWLRANGFFYKDDSVILVSTPLNKIDYIKLALFRKFNVVYIDDLSYNHENNKIQFYSSIINEIKDLNISYIGYDEINKINNAL